MLLRKAATILRQDGIVELLSRAKRYLARRIEGTFKATSVTHEQAMQWFEHRRDGYDRLISAVTSHVREDAVLFDVGANVGYFSYRLTQRIDFRGSVHLFEPLAHLADLSRCTFQGVPFPVAVHTFGLSDVDANEDIFIASNGNLGWNTLLAQRATPDMTKVRIELKRFDTCGITAQPSFIKIDVEGAEYRVFRGMLGSLKRWRPLPVMLCEIGFGESHPFWRDELEVFAELKNLGYRICDLEQQPLEIGSLKGTTDVLFIPGSPI